MAFGTRWVVVVLKLGMSEELFPSEPPTIVQRLPNVGVWNTLGSRCANVAGSLGMNIQ